MLQANEKPRRRKENLKTNYFGDDHAQTIEKVKNKESFCINLNELGPAVLGTFFEHAPDSTVFYGVRGEDYYDKLEVVVFAVNE